MYRNILLGIILGLTLIFLALIILLGNQWFYEGEGDKDFKEHRYEEAAENFLKAYDHARWLGQGRLLYKIGLCYENHGEYDRARDYYIELVRLYPSAPLVHLVGPRLLQMFQNEADPVPGDLAGLRALGLVATRTKFHRAFKNLHRAVSLNKSGVSANLLASYEAYKVYHQEYKKQIARALAEYKEGHPGFVWPPRGTPTEGPDPVSVRGRAQAERQVQRSKPQPARPVRREPIKPRVESRPVDIDSELSSGTGAADPIGP